MLRGRNGSRDAIAGVGGRGWTQDLATVISEIEDGWRYYVRVGPALVNVVLVNDSTCPLRTDPHDTEKNELLTLPGCPIAAA